MNSSLIGCRTAYGCAGVQDLLEDGHRYRAHDLVAGPHRHGENRSRRGDLLAQAAAAQAFQAEVGRGLVAVLDASHEAKRQRLMVAHDGGGSREGLQRTARAGRASRRTGRAR